MLDRLSTLIVSLPERVLLGIACAYVSALFGLPAIMATLVGIMYLELPMILMGIGGLLGLSGWWLRVIVPQGAFAPRPRLRRTMFALLLIGTLCCACVTAYPGGSMMWILVPITLAGAIMAAGTLRAPAT